MSKRRVPREAADASPAGPRTLIEQAYVRLRDDIVERRLLPGEKLRIEHLRARYGVGAGTLREALTAAYRELSACPVSPEHRKRWEALNARFHEVLIAGRPSPWTLRVWRVLARHGERYRSQAIALHAAQGRDVDAEHRQIYEAALEGNEARAALALEAHIRATLDLLARAGRSTAASPAPPPAALAAAQP